MSPPSPAPRLNLFDAVCVNVGIIIGAGIYRSTPMIAGNVTGLAELLAVWIAGGLAALVGALCYSELATRFPRHGGEYVYLGKGLHPGLGLLFAWCEFWIIRPGNIGAMAFVFGEYARELTAAIGWETNSLPWVCGAIALFSGVNYFGVQLAKWTQNILAVVKVASVVLIVIVALTVAPAESATLATAANPPSSNYKLAMIFVLFAYGGWNELAYAAAEVREPRRNLWRALLLSVVVVVSTYLLFNVACVRALGFNGVANSQAVAAEVIGLAFGDIGRAIMSAMICLSCLGAINGMIFTGSRLAFAWGSEHALFRWLGHWNSQRHVPTRAILGQACVTLAIVILFSRDGDGFDNMIAFTAPVFMGFIFLVAVCCFVLRARDTKENQETFLVPLFPLAPLLFCGWVLFMVWSSIEYAATKPWQQSLWVVAVLICGVLAVAASFRLSSKKTT